MFFKEGSPTLAGKIATITCSGGTGTAQALYRGYEQIVNLNEPGALNVILLFTDGVPNTVTASFPVNRLDTTRNADHALGLANRSSRCYDYEHNRRYNYVGANPQWSPSTNMVYKGAIYAQEGLGAGDGISGILGASTTNFADAAAISRPHQSASGSATQYNATGFENDCFFRGGAGAGTSSTQLQYDIAYYPDTDIYGTSMISSDNYRSLAYYPASSPYANKISVDDTTNMMNASINAVDNMGKRIRNNDLNAGINTVVYSIGLGDVGADGHTLLRRIANDALSPIYDANKLEGLYVYAPSAADLNAAFVRIASEILRYAQ
jgi:hypothetical protein